MSDYNDNIISESSIFSDKIYVDNYSNERNSIPKVFNELYKYLGLSSNIIKLETGYVPNDPIHSEVTNLFMMALREASNIAELVACYTSSTSNNYDILCLTSLFKKIDYQHQDLTYAFDYYKSFIFLKVKQMFDPPSNQVINKSITDQLEKYAFDMQCMETDLINKIKEYNDVVFSTQNITDKDKVYKNLFINPSNMHYYNETNIEALTIIKYNIL